MRILIVEDEREIADGISKILTKAGYEADTVYDGLDGLEYILSDIYDLILLDIMLPKINGIDVLKSARSEGITTPVIILTAKFQPGGQDNGTRQRSRRLPHKALRRRRASREDQDADQEKQYRRGR